jgi:hypothetical protein
LYEENFLFSEDKKEEKSGISDYYCSRFFGAEVQFAGAPALFHNYKGNEDIRCRSNIPFPKDILQLILHNLHRSYNNERLQSVPA